METGSKDYASKEWLRDEPDPFLVDPDVAFFLTVCAGFMGYLLGSYL